jgi:hypothetical protein
VTALAWAAPFLILGGCTAYALSVRGGHEQPARYAILRARWAWRCRQRWRHRGRPAIRDEGGVKLSYEEAQALGSLAAGRDVRART